MITDFTAAQIIAEYLADQDSIFTGDEFYRTLKNKGVKITKAQSEDILRSSDYVFPLIDNEYITRAGVFTGRWFSFKPTKEEVEKGYFIIGHRCMPFLNPDISPDSISVITKTFKEVDAESCVFTMNTAMDIFAFYGEGYVLPYIINDRANDKVQLASIQYNLPSEIKLTAWPLKKLCPKGYKFRYGDRILCRVMDWNASIVEMSLQKNENLDGTLAVSESDLQREEWYTHFENGLLESFDRNGPSDSIEEQLAMLFLENQEELCIKNCGSSEEFLKHTRKIGFSSFGVESRIWKTGEDVPYIGEWNKEFSKEVIMSDISMTFSPQIIDAYLEDNIYKGETKKEVLDIPELTLKIFPSTLRMSPDERKLLLLNIEKRNDILKKEYKSFTDYPVAPIRQRMLDLLTDVSSLLCDIGCSGVNVELFPQQELVVLTQIFSHVIKMIEEVENVFMRENIPFDDLALSLDGMEDTFEGIYDTLYSALKEKRSKAFEILKQ